MERAKSTAWAIVAALTVLFLVGAALLFSGTRTTTAQENARAAQAAGRGTEQTASGASAGEHGTTAKSEGKAEGQSVAGEQKDSEQPATSQGNSAAGTEDGALAGATSTTEENKNAAPTVHPAFDLKDGAELYAAACQSCHMPGGVGADGGAGTKNYPALAGNQNLQTPAYPATFILNGAGGMPSFSNELTDEQIAAIINYLRTDLNKFDGEITPAEIAPIRSSARSTNLGDDAG